MSDSTTPLKRCTKCDVEKPATLEYFYKRKDGRDDLYTDCIACRRENASRKRQTPERLEIERARARDRDRKRRSDPEKREKDYQANNERRRKRYAVDAQYAEEKRARSRDRQRVRLQSDPMYRAKQQAETGRRRREKRLRRDPGLIERERHHVQLRLARKSLLPHDFTMADWRDSLTYWKQSCCYCGAHQAELSDTLQRDHFIPLTLNGGYTASNIVPACKSCNSSKCNKNPHEWLVMKLDEAQASVVLARIESYFASLHKDD